MQLRTKEGCVLVCTRVQRVVYTPAGVHVCLGVCLCVYMGICVCTRSLGPRRAGRALKRRETKARKHHEGQKHKADRLEDGSRRETTIPAGLFLPAPEIRTHQGGRSHPYSPCGAMSPEVT